MSSAALSRRRWSRSSRTHSAFIPGATTDDNITHFNEQFYGRLHDGKDYHLLLHDYQKAYDSVSRDYLFKLIERIGMPLWAINILQVVHKEHSVPNTEVSPSSEISNGQRAKAGLSPLTPAFQPGPRPAPIATSGGRHSRRTCLLRRPGTWLPTA